MTFLRKLKRVRELYLLPPRIELVMTLAGGVKLAAIRVLQALRPSVDRRVLVS
jgi:hypothetical protein